MTKIESKNFYKQLFFFAIPIAFQEFLNALINLLDTFMLGSIGDIAVTAAGNGNELFFLFTLLLFGICSGASIFLAQQWGKKDKDSMQKTLAVAFSIAALATVFFFVVCFFFPRQMIGIYNSDERVISEGASYLRIVALVFPFFACSTLFRVALRCMGITRIQLLATVVALITNFVLNSVMIFGLFGFPAMGVAGAALATLIARIVEFAIIVFIIYYQRLPIALRFKTFKLLKLADFKVFLNEAGVIIVNEICWSVGTTVYYANYGKLGIVAQSAVKVAGAINSLFFTLTNSVASAGSIMMGNILGEQDREGAIEYSKKLLRIIPLIGAVLGIILFTSKSLMLMAFPEISSKAREYATMILSIIAFMMPIRALNHLIIVGILRCGGDAKWSFIVDVGAVWLVGVPMSFFAVYYLKLPIDQVFALVALEEVFKMVLGLTRVKSNKWANIL